MTGQPESGARSGPIPLDEHRGLAVQKATGMRRLLSEVGAQRSALAARQQELEKHLLATPADSWEEAVDKARYPLLLFASAPAAEDPRRRLIENVPADFDRLLGESSINAFVGAIDE